MTIMVGSSSRSSKFTRSSDAESICNSCLATLKASRSLPLDVAEEIHSDLCLATNDSPFDLLLS
ncbi:MAG TPA: hypothetical protein VMT56_01535 [Candidatus Bathyarchaeia archaeon]|nr:hypothetical protein [Candidatus Bathyarchaeia archaeon]